MGENYLKGSTIFNLWQIDKLEEGVVEGPLSTTKETFQKINIGTTLLPHQAAGGRRSGLSETRGA